MNHDEAISRLPWYLADSLDELEKAAIRGHLEHCPECRAELARSQAAARVFEAEHPTPEEIVDEAWERLDEARSVEIRLHLTECRDCREEWELVRASRELEAAEPERIGLRTSPEASRRWPLALAASVALVSTLAAFGLLRTTIEEREGHRTEVAALRTEIASQRAATSSAAERAAGLEQRLDSLLAPRAGVPVVELLPDSVLRGPLASEAPTIGRPTSSFVLLVVALENPRAHPTFAARLLDGDGELRLAFPPAAPDATGALNLLVPFSSLPSGPATLEVREGDQDESRAVGRYHFSVKSEGSQP